MENKKGIRKTIQQPFGMNCRDLKLLAKKLPSPAYLSCVLGQWQSFWKINKLLSNGNNLQDLEYYQVSNGIIKVLLGKIADGAVVVVHS